MLANEYGIMEMLDEYSKKNNILDDHAKEHANMLK